MNTAISVIIPTHNRIDYLNEALKSVIEQDFTNWEIIVVDDFSDPPVTEAFIKQFNCNIHLVRHCQAMGGAAAKNTGVKLAKGKYVAFLDDDDLYSPNYLTVAVDFLDKFSHINVLFMGVKWFSGDMIWKDYNQDDALKKITSYASVDSYNFTHKFDSIALFHSLLSGVPMAFQRPVTTLEHFKNVGFYEEGCLLWDCEWALRASLAGTCALINQGLYWQRDSHQGYFSQSNKIIEQSISILDIKKSFLSRDLKSELVKPIKKSIIQAEKDLSWNYIKNNKHALAFTTILNSFQYGFNLAQIKLLLSITFKYFSFVLNKIKSNI